ncbi:acyl carrier protein mitochondrial precursor [Perkinsela sp. CCAP 1560/4]|nr:acyl carrier protein mitochondrial precursor [Perkinsela sp. CCAP 1560/4]|eukprot:KNH08387.1 acyl carrier protein mitochondrial precursor [Perkinsela sp. CCAP 1560/4]
MACRQSSTRAVACASSSPLFQAIQKRYCAVGKDDSGNAKEAKKYLLDREVVKQRVMDVIKNFEKVDAAKVTETSHFIEDLNLDSLDVVEVVMALEQEFVLDMPDHDAERISTIAEAIEYIATNPLAK